MTQAQRLVRQPASEKKWLNRTETDLINDARCLPDDHSSSEYEEPIWSVPRQAKPVLEVIRGSGLVPELEKRLSSHPGKQSRFSIEALILCTILAGGLKNSYRRVDICAVANGLDAKVGYELGTWTPEDTRPITYDTVRKQHKRFEGGLDEGWTGSDGTPRDLAWFCHTFIAATVPYKYRQMIEAISLDSTVSATWAVTHDYRKEKDALAEYQLESLEDPDLPEPELPTPTTSQTGKVGDLGPDGRIQRSKDPDARPTYKSATSKEPARIVLGYDVHLATAVRSVTWTGDPDKVAFGPAPPAFITSICVAPGATHPGTIGVGIVEQSLRIAPRLGEVVVDRGYSTKRVKFNRLVHALGINVVMDYTSTDIDHPKLIKVGRKGQRLLVSCGDLFSPWLREDKQIPPEDADPKWFADRALWRWKPNQNLKNGGKQFLCPQCAGKVATNAKTRMARTTNSDGPFLSIEDEYCCLGLASVSLALLDSFQRIPYGTLAWKQSYGRRNIVEKSNAMLKDKGGLQAGWCRAFGLAAHTIGALALVIVHNLRELKREAKRELKRILSRQKRNGVTPEPSHNGTGTASTTADSLPITLSSRGPP